MEEFKKYLNNQIKKLENEIDSILDIDTKRKKIYRKEVCIIFLELINEYESKIKEERRNENDTRI